MASRLFDYFKFCWKNGTITETQLTAAVGKGYITEEEKQEIMAQ